MSKSSEKIRIDHLIVQRGLVESREKAKALIMAGLVTVDGQRVDKAGKSVPASADVTLTETLKYVSRGGLKLEAALENFPVNVNGLKILDAGASTGGFTDCLLQHGAARVIAVDVGYGQFDWRLRQDPRVRLLEKTNIRYMKASDINEAMQGAVIDVSFISLKRVVPAVTDLLEKQAFIVALIKPQFEVGKNQVGKGGVVRDPFLHQEVVDNLKVFFIEQGWQVKGGIPSPVLGPKGNREFLIYVTRGGWGK